MTYRRDSNVLNAYGKIVPISRKAIQASKEGKWLPFDPTNNPFPSTSKLTEKDKDIGWMVSHCQTESRREDIVKNLQEISNLTIDIFGKHFQLQTTISYLHNYQNKLNVIMKIFLFRKMW